jgi:hypothetical protein
VPMPERAESDTYKQHKIPATTQNGSAAFAAAAPLGAEQSAAHGKPMGAEQSAAHWKPGGAGQPVAYEKSMRDHSRDRIVVDAATTTLHPVLSTTATRAPRRSSPTLLLVGSGEDDGGRCYRARGSGGGGDEGGAGDDPYPNGGSAGAPGGGDDDDGREDYGYSRNHGRSRSSRKPGGDGEGDDDDYSYDSSLSSKASRRGSQNRLKRRDIMPLDEIKVGQSPSAGQFRVWKKLYSNMDTAANRMDDKALAWVTKAEMFNNVSADDLQRVPGLVLTLGRRLFSALQRIAEGYLDHSEVFLFNAVQRHLQRTWQQANREKVSAAILGSGHVAALATSTLQRVRPTSLERIVSTHIR